MELKIPVCIPDQQKLGCCIIVSKSVVLVVLEKFVRNTNVQFVRFIDLRELHQQIGLSGVDACFPVKVANLDDVDVGLLVIRAEIEDDIPAEVRGCSVVHENGHQAKTKNQNGQRVCTRPNVRGELSRKSG